MIVDSLRCNTLPYWLAIPSNRTLLTTSLQNTDTEHLYTLTTNKIANQYGKTYTWEIKTRLMGLMGREAAVAITAALDLPMTPEEYMTESQEIMSQLFSDCTVLPGQKQCTNYSKSVMMLWPTKSSQLRLELVFPSPRTNCRH